MPKEEKEFYDPSLKHEWKTPGEGSGVVEEGKVFEMVLSKDEETGNITRLLKFLPGMETEETVTHDFWEEVYIVQGALIDKRKNEIYNEGMYACRPPGMEHGPYRIPESGCVTFEVRYYE